MSFPKGKKKKSKQHTGQYLQRGPFTLDLSPGTQIGHFFFFFCFLSGERERGERDQLFLSGVMGCLQPLGKLLVCLNPLSRENGMQKLYKVYLFNLSNKYLLSIQSMPGIGYTMMGKHMQHIFSRCLQQTMVRVMKEMQPTSKLKSKSWLKQNQKTALYPDIYANPPTPSFILDRSIHPPTSHQKIPLQKSLTPRDAFQESFPVHGRIKSSTEPTLLI